MKHAIKTAQDAMKLHSKRDYALPLPKVSSTGGMITYTKTGLVHISGKYKYSLDSLNN